MNIAELISNGVGVTISVTPTDLKEFALELLEEANQVKKEPEQFLTADETSKKLNVTSTTLWRWNKENYLKPIKIGRKPYYKLSDVNKLMEG
jgi:predicted DNA-binding transcriptional regulator AlpA